jgi:Co/Zn/Cd efflux system component
MDLYARRRDVAVNLSGLTILLTGFGFVDLIVGAAIGLYVIREALENLRKAGEARKAPSDSEENIRVLTMLSYFLATK